MQIFDYDNKVEQRVLHELMDRLGGPDCHVHIVASPDLSGSQFTILENDSLIVSESLFDRLTEQCSDFVSVEKMN